MLTRLTTGQFALFTRSGASKPLYQLSIPLARPPKHAFELCRTPFWGQANLSHISPMYSIPTQKNTPQAISRVCPPLPHKLNLFMLIQSIDIRPLLRAKIMDAIPCTRYQHVYDRPVPEGETGENRHIDQCTAPHQPVSILTHEPKGNGRIRNVPNPHLKY